MDKLNVFTQFSKPFLTENLRLQDLAGQSMVLLMLILWVQSLYGPFLDLMLLVGSLQLRFSQNHRIWLLALVSEGLKIISVKY